MKLDRSGSRPAIGGRVGGRGHFRGGATSRPSSPDALPGHEARKLPRERFLYTNKNGYLIQPSNRRLSGFASTKRFPPIRSRKTPRRESLARDVIGDMR